MLPDREPWASKFVEGFEWKNKIRLFDLIKKHKTPNVLLLSGDIHMASIYKQNCQALTG